MKQFLLISVLMVCALTARAQYVPNSSQLFQFSSAFNPAFTGVESYNDIKLGGRYQWTGYGANAPKFLNAVANFRIKQPLDFETNGVRLSNANLLQDKTIVPRRKQIIHGLGGAVFYEKVGIVTRTGTGVNYSFQYPISKKLRLSLGVGAMLESERIGVGDIYLGEGASSDPYIENLLKSGSNHTEINLRGGVLLYAKSFYLGFSYLPVYTTMLKSSDISVDEPFYQGTAQIGYCWMLNPKVSLKPSIAALWLTSGEFSFNYNLKAYFQDKLWFGVTYQDTKSTVFLAGFEINKSMGVSYSYEMSMGEFKQFGDGSHDLVLSLRLNNFKREEQYTW